MSLGSLKASLLSIVLVAVGGCQQHKQAGQAGPDAMASRPDLAALNVPPEIAAKATDAAGGFTEWTHAKKLQLDCVVTIYRPDGGYYLTEHRYDIYPWSRSIRISAQEPLSRFVWQFADGEFSMLEGNENADVSRMPLPYCDFAEAVLKITTAPVSFWDKTNSFAVLPGPVRIKGLWYSPIEQVGRIVQSKSSQKRKGIESLKPHWSKVIYFQNTESFLVDLIWFGDVDSQKYIAVRGYDYREAAKGAVSVPSKIEIFKTDPQFVLGERLVQIDLK